jgi:anthranilate synthase/phosphoribosyltransferase
MILMIDNYDSFTYNLYQYLCEAGFDVQVFRNDELTVQQIEQMPVEGIVISPGPGRPCDAGISLEVITHFSGKLPILGVCLGHQSIGEAFGGKIVQAKAIMHGKVSEITHNEQDLFLNIRNPMKVVRYHSLAVEEASLPDCLEVTARTEDGEIMGLKHKEHPTMGVQFHPESILTTAGKRLLLNMFK